MYRDDMLSRSNKSITSTKSIMCIWLLLKSLVPLVAQNVIGGATADPTAILDLQSNSRGLLMPRMTTAQRTAIINPAVGLMLYNTSLGCVEVNTGVTGNPDWTCLFVVGGQVATLDCAPTAGSYTVPVGIPVSELVLPISYTGGAGGFYSSQAVSSTGVTGLTASIAAGAFGYGAGSIQCRISGTPTEVGVASFALSIGGIDCILELTVQPVGEVSSVNCADAVNTGIVVAGVAVSGMSSTVLYEGGNGGDYSAQTLSSTGVTGLTATLSAGTLANGSGSLVYMITGIPSGAGTASFALSIGGQSCSLNITVAAASVGNCGAFIAAGMWKEFLCHNLGANTNAGPLIPSWELVGNYYQWGRNPNCFGLDGLDGTNPCSSPVYGAVGPLGSTAANDNEGRISGWNTVSASNGAWQDAIKTANDPCPTGFRVPTQAQWEGVINESLNANTFVGTWTSSSTNYTTGVKFGTSLFLPAAGFRGGSSGSLIQRGGVGGYWSSTSDYEFQSFGWFLELNNGYIGMRPQLSISGFSVRCIAE